MTVAATRAQAGSHRRPGRRSRDRQSRATSAPLSPPRWWTSKSIPIPARCKILRCTIAQDAGKAIHPSYVEGQMQGGTAQGLGWAMNEEYVYDSKGILRNIGLLDYRMPTCLDLPMIETIMVEVAEPGASVGHPRGRRSFDRAAAGRSRQCDLSCDRNSDDRIADVAAAHPQGADGTSRDGAGASQRRGGLNESSLLQNAKGTPEERRSVRTRESRGRADELSLRGMRPQIPARRLASATA